MTAPYKLIACEVLKEEALATVREQGGEASCDCEWLPMGLHERPVVLRAELGRRVAACAGRGYRAVLLLFGLCSRATAGLEPPADSLLVVPRVHDCVALHLGSADRHRAMAEAEAGTLWLGRGFLRAGGEAGGLPAFGALGLAVDPVGADGRRKSAEAIRRDLVRDYGEEAAAHLVRELGESWKKNYARVVHMEWEGDRHCRRHRSAAAAFAAENGWRLETARVDLRLVRMLLAGDWPESEFAVVRPGWRLAADDSPAALRVVRVDESM